jgi:activator of HSP90 ATPase
MQFTRAQAQVEPKEGGEFVILEGKIRGKFLKLRENEYIKMEWRLSEWKEPSTV